MAEKEKIASESQDVRLHWLLQFTKAINYNLPAAQLFEIYVSVLRDHLGIGRMVLLLHDGDWRTVAHYGTVPEALLPDAHDLLRMVPLFTGSEGKIPAWMEQFETIIPVSHHNRPLAYAFLGDLERQVLPSKRDAVSYIHTITNVIAVAIENKRMMRESIERAALQRELELAAEMQSMLFPSNLGTHGFLDVAATYIPHTSVGGDYYDLITLNHDEALVCMADVSGKGLPAALLMSNFQANLHALIRHTDFTLTQLVTELNACVNRSAQGEKYITFFVARVHRARHTIEYINAGHNPPLLVSGDLAQVLDKGTTGLGMFEDLPFLNTETVNFTPGSLLFCYTDGITEMENIHGKHFGSEALATLLLEHHILESANLLHQKVVDTLNAFRQDTPYTDDVTFLSLRYR